MNNTDFNRPAPIECPSCNIHYEFSWDGDEWNPMSEWWSNDEYEFICSRFCWQKLNDMDKEYDNTHR